jgi:hypothetical protein
LNTPDDELSPSEQEQLKRLAVETDPPAALENRVLDAMRSQGMIRKTPFLRAAAAIAAAVTLFVAGVIADRYWPAPAAPGDPRPQFVLMLYEDSAYETASPAELAGRIAEYGNWARSLGSQNYVTGQKLVETESTISRTGTVGPTPPTPKDGSVAGYFIIRATDAQEAARVAATCPHVRYGGQISVREIER